MQFRLRYLVILLFLVGILTRTYYFIYPLGRSAEITVDEAVYGLQSGKILAGEWPVFYPAQDYTGSFSAYLSAFLFWLFGVSTVSLKIIPFLFSIGTIFTIYLLAQKAFGQSVGIFTLFVSSLGTPFWNNWSSRAGTGYVEATFLGTLVLILTLEIVKDTREPGGRRYLTIILGFLSGLGFWIQPTIIYFMIPSLIFLLIKLRKKFLIIFLMFILGFLVGAGPVIYYNTVLKPSATSFALIKKPWGVRGAFNNLTIEGFPVLLGGRTSNSRADLNLAVSKYIYLLFFLSLIYFTKIVFDSHHPRPAARLIYLTFVVAMAVFLISTPFNQLSIEPRYLYALYVPIPIIFGCFFERILRFSKLFLFLLLSFYTLNFFIGLFLAGPLVFLDSYKFGPLVNFFRQTKISYAITSSSVGHRLSFFSGGRVKVAVRGGGITEARFEKDNQEVIRVRDSDPRLAAYVTLEGDPDLPGVRNEAQTQLGDQLSEDLVSGRFKVFYAASQRGNL